MIYFDNNKNAYAYEIPDYAAKISDELWDEFNGTDKWDIVNGEFKDISNTEEYKQAKAAKEQDKINHLTMTALDFIKAVKSMGLTDEQVENYLNQNLDVKHQLMFCQNVYCGVVKQLCPLSIGEVNITEAQVETLFKTKYNMV